MNRAHWLRKSLLELPSCTESCSSATSGIKFSSQSRGLWIHLQECFGIPPDIYVEATEEDFARGIDPVLEYAIELVNSQQ